jgi:hypothetical protein
VSATPPADAVAFAEKALALLDQGSYTATYKYAVLLALIDTCLEGADRHGRPPARVHPRTLAERVVELYWPQTSPYSPDEHEAVVLRQNRGGQAEIIRLIRRFRDDIEGGRGRLAGPRPPRRRPPLRPAGGRRRLEAGADAAAAAAAVRPRRGPLSLRPRLGRAGQPPALRRR